MLINNNYQVLNNNQFVDFEGIVKSTKDVTLEIHLENKLIIRSGINHLFPTSSNLLLKADELVPNLHELITKFGNSKILNIIKINESVDVYDLVNVGIDNLFYANDILVHNCSFLGSGENFIDEEFIKRIEDKELINPIATEYTDKFLHIFEEPIPNAKYVMSLDAASGYASDFSTMIILKTTEVIIDQEYIDNGIKKFRKRKETISEQVAEYRGKVTPQQLADMAYYYGTKYNNAYCTVDVSGGYGVATVEGLKMFGYNNIHYSDVAYKPSRDRLNVYVKTVERDMGNGQIKKVDLIPGFMIGSNRPLVLQEMERSIRLKNVIIRSSRITDEFKTFVIVDNKTRLADHKRTYHDDLIMALAMGLYVINCEMHKDINNTERIKSMLNAILVVNDNSNVLPEEPKHGYTDDFNVNVHNPYGANSWLFKGLNKNR